MTLHVALQHRTSYRYDRLVALAPQFVRLRPAPHTRTRVLTYSQQVTPAAHFINWQQDPCANYVARLDFPARTDHLQVEVSLVVEMAAFNPFDFFLAPSAEYFPFDYAPQLRQELQAYLAEAPAPPALQEFIAALDTGRQRSVDFLVGINRQIQQRIGYLIRMEPGVQTPEQTLRLGSGSCRDSSWLLVQCLRHLGLAARFVSGYLIQLKADADAAAEAAAPAADFCDLHAWCEVYLPGAGWLGLDPTSGLVAGEGHIPLACTPAPGSAAPISGELEPCAVSFTHHMTVTRVHESARVSWPYRDAQWAAIDALGERVDAELQLQDVRLTMGGEPTFVARDDRDAAEWNTTALGPSKRAYATDLLLRLREKHARGGFMHFGQGKWYPGEPLPRWALAVYWRRDGQPVWLNPARCADERTLGAYGAADAQRLIVALADRLRLDTRYAIPAYEDVWYYLWRERRLPVNVDPFDSRLDDELERERLRRVFSAGLAAVVGYALPLRRVAADGLPADAGWRTDPWHFREQRLYLTPGDSPMGWRLPLDALPWASPAQRWSEVPRDPYAPHPPLPAAPLPRAPLRQPVPDAAARASAGVADRGPSPSADAPGAATAPAASFQGVTPAPLAAAADLTRTALCVEPRAGKLYLFLPPLALLEDYLALLAVIEATLADLDLQIILEGYPPPPDARLQVLQLTPDPGVIEVNVHPAANWRELVERTEHLYAAAAASGLSAEKFMLDGRHVGTGGGNHLVLGGPTTADSPLLRRPDLLASLIAYWHNHPALSYLFSGLFIGPTSQAPRVDEARNDQVYELEIALGELQRCAAAAAAPRPWLVDRLLRHLLIDVTGNTHRAEFCIDKLYSPDGPAGRLGLLELRACEMPPHARMSLVHQLLVRALVAHFWRTPYRSRLTRWGTQLHDRFLLPTWVALDLEDILADLRAAGYAFEPDWFAPHWEWRFPLLGQIAVRGIELSLRAALEPWHVLGEEGASAGTVRYVDASLERLEVRLTGLNDQRHLIQVNGRSIPLQPTGRAGEFVAGVRYRAWRLPAALHPTIDVHAPLRFEIIDTWARCALAACTYHVVHPGGRNYERYPINAAEAQSRRLARFCRMGQTPGMVQAAAAERSLEFPLTLDLRR